MERLPGGLFLDGRLERDAALREPSGDTEVVLAQMRTRATPVAARVTEVLCHALAHVGGRVPEPALVAGLSVPDRQYLMRVLGAALGLDEVWVSPTCGSCGGRFDFRVRPSTLPVKPAGQGYPFASALTSQGPCRLRVPTGADQEALATLGEPGQVARALVGRCLDLPRGAAEGAGACAGRVERLTEADLRALEAALERVMPELTTGVRAECPECGASDTVEVDPYLCMNAAGGRIFQEVHLLASAYHWGQQEILALPRARRRLYLELIERGRSAQN